MATGPLITKAVLIEKGDVYVGDNAGNAVNLGAVRKVIFTGKQYPTKVESDNRGEIISKVRVNGEISLEWLEPASPTNLVSMFKGLITLTTVAGSATAVTGEVAASGSWAYNKIIFFANQSGDTTKPTSITVTAGTDGLLVDVTDYDITQDPGTLKWGVSIKDSSTVTTVSQTITLAYTYTPNTSVVVTGGTNLTQTNRYVKIVGPSEADSNVTRTIELASCLASSDIVLPFVDVETAKDSGIMPVKFEGNKGTTWTYTDTINAN